MSASDIIIWPFCDTKGLPHAVDQPSIHSHIQHISSTMKSQDLCAYNTKTSHQIHSTQTCTFHWQMILVKWLMIVLKTIKQAPNIEFSARYVYQRQWPIKNSTLRAELAETQLIQICTKIDWPMINPWVFSNWTSCFSITLLTNGGYKITWHNWVLAILLLEEL